MEKLCAPIQPDNSNALSFSKVPNFGKGVREIIEVVQLLFKSFFTLGKLSKKFNLMVPLLPDKYYHIYNRANGDEHIFKNEDNYRYLLKRYAHFINPVASTLSYCLMKNHFHFLIRVKTNVLNEKSEGYISQQFSNLFSSYTQALNKQQNRKGSLFMKNFKRKEINTDVYLKRIIHYIHFNPVRAGLCTAPSEYKYSSYKAILSKKFSDIERQEVLDLFDNADNFIYVHRKPIEISGIGIF